MKGTPFLGQGIPPANTFNVTHLTAAVCKTLHVLSYDAIWADQGTHHLPRRHRVDALRVMLGTRDKKKLKKL